MITPETKEIIGLDLGLKRTGIARASASVRLSEPVTTVPTEKTLETLRRLMAGKELEAVVVGLPRSLNGNDTDQTKWVREWVKSAKKDLETDFFWQDEALTSRVAQERKTNDIDAEAAAIILQDFLDTPAEQRVLC